MSWGHEALELDEDADERAVKRAYAKRLRATRPDEDPAGFQRLHEAYQAALAYAKYRAQWGPDEDEQDDSENVAETVPVLPATDLVSVESPEPPAPSAERASSVPFVAGLRPLEAESDELGQHDPVVPVASGSASPSVPPVRPDLHVSELGEPPLDVAAFAERVLNAASKGPPVEFEHWLQQRQELWSLRDKPLVGAHLLWHVIHGNAPVRMENFDALSRCFGWDEVGSELDPDTARTTRQRLHREWAVQPDNHAWLAHYLNRPGASVNPAQAGQRLAWLSRPQKRWRALLYAALLERVPAMRHLLDVLGIETVEQAPASLEREQVAFWLALTRPGQFNVPKMQLVALRSLACALAWLTLIGVAALGVRPNGPRSMGQTLDLGLYGALLLFVGGMLVMPMRRLLEWQSADEVPGQRGLWLQRLLVPTLAIASILIIHALDQRIAGTLLAFPTALIALVRWWRRGAFELQFSGRFGGWGLLALVPLVKVGGVALLFGEIPAAAALILWAIDAVNNCGRR